jgi:hypothetical protein
MKRIEGLGTDVRHLIKRANWRIGYEPSKTSVTWHYNGPAIAGSEVWTPAHAVSFINRVDVPNHISRIGADGLQYHYFVLGSGEILQTRDLDAILWHCANGYGNRKSVAVHLPVGKNRDGSFQKLTEAQAGALYRLTDELINEFDMSGREVVYGHGEWKGAATECPGLEIKSYLNRYREGEHFKKWTHYRLLYDNVNVRQGPSTSYPVAIQLDRDHPLATFYGDGLTRGQVISGSEWWVHRADHIGFIHESLVERI